MGQKLEIEDRGQPPVTARVEQNALGRWLFRSMLILLLTACHNAPTPTSPLISGPEVRETSGQPLTFVSGESGQPVVGALVVIGDGRYTTDARGQLTPEPGTAADAPLQVIASGFFDRKTMLRATRFSLWPRNSATGTDEGYTAKLVYNCATEDCATRGEPLSRIVDAHVLIVPSAELRADAAALRAHEAAARLMSAATQGAVTFSVAGSAPAAGVVVTTAVNPNDRDLAAYDAAALVWREFGGGASVVRATIVIRSLELARQSPLLLHELGHAFGLAHSPRVGDVMWNGPELYDVTNLSPREKLTVSLMLQRYPGNRFPDDDHVLAASGYRRRSLLVCAGD